MQYYYFFLHSKIEKYYFCNKRMIMKKNLLLLISAMLILPISMCSCDNDDEKVIGEGLTGKWDLVKVLDGPNGQCEDGYVEEYTSGSVVIEFQGNGKAVFKYDTGKKEAHAYSVPEYQKGDVSPYIYLDDILFYYTIEKNRLTLRYGGIYACDHIPATFVFKRTN